MFPKDGKIEDLTFRDILKLLRKDDLLVLNNTKVIKARLNGNKESGGAVEAMLERISGEYEVLMLRSSKSPKPGTKLFLSKMEWKEGQKQRSRAVRGILSPAIYRACSRCFRKFGKVPLPPYITHAASKSDESRYQTVYAKERERLLRLQQDFTLRMNCLKTSRL